MKPDEHDLKTYETRLRLQIVDDLHDLMQRLRVLGAEAKATLTDDTSHWRQMLDRLEPELNDAIRDMKRIVAPFVIELEQDMPIAPLERFVADLHKLSRQYEAASRRITIDCPPEEIVDISPRYYPIIHRVVENCLGNAIRHGKATKIIVALRRNERNKQVMLLQIMDNGQGDERLNNIHDLVNELPERHRGLRLILEQVDKLGADIRVTSIVGKMTTFSITIPGKKDASESSPGKSEGRRE